MTGGVTAPIAAIAAPRAAAGAPVASAPLPDRGGLPAGVPAARRVSKADGPFPIDYARAKRDAEKVLGSIDFSRRDIVIWAPGTGSTRMYGPLFDAVHDTWTDGDVSVVPLQYPASIDLRHSVATGIETLRLVLEGIRARGGNHRVLLVGVSQGSWLIGEVMADPRVRDVVERAVLTGHPALALHQYTDGHDPKVLVINHKADPITLPVRGNQTVALDAMVAANLLQWGRMGTVARAAIENPHIAVRLLGSVVHVVPGLRSIFVNAHDYGAEMPWVARYLRHGAAAGAPLPSG